MDPVKGRVKVKQGHRDIIDRVLYNFLTEIKPGDIVVAFEDRKFVGITEICLGSRYSYDGRYEYAHGIGPVRWVDYGSNPNDFSFHIGTCGARGFPGISQQKNHRATIIQEWDNYKRTQGFNPCP